MVWALEATDTAVGGPIFPEVEAKYGTAVFAGD